MVSFITMMMLFVAGPSAVFIMAKSQPISIEERNVVYQLPHPGMLPDNPFYFAKEVRDSMAQVATRDALRKSELALVVSDRKAAESLSLAQKGKDTLALQTITEAEKEFAQISIWLKESKASGVNPTNDFMDILYQSNTKHKEVILELMKELPQENLSTIKKVFDQNETIYKELKKIR